MPLYKLPLIMAFNVQEHDVFVHKFSKISLPSLPRFAPPPPPKLKNPGYASARHPSIYSLQSEVITACVSDPSIHFISNMNILWIFYILFYLPSIFIYLGMLGLRWLCRHLWVNFINWSILKKTKEIVKNLCAKPMKSYSLVVSQILTELSSREGNIGI